MIQSESLGFMFSLKIVDEEIDPIAAADLTSTLGTVLRNYYGTVEQIAQAGCTVTLKVPGRDLFKAEKTFNGFLAQLRNQWEQGVSRRARGRQGTMTKHANGDVMYNSAVPENFKVGKLGKLEPKYLTGPTPATWKHGAFVQGHGASEHKSARPEPVADEEPCYGLDDEPTPAKVEAPPLFAKTSSVLKKYAEKEFPGIDFSSKIAAVPKAEEEPVVPEPEPLAPMSAEQQAAYDKILGEPGHFFLTGKAGTGKSHVIKHLIKSGRCRASATTARAALIVGGTTIDRLFCFEREKWQIRGYDRLTDIMARSPGIIVCDEGSMAGFHMAGVFEKVCKDFRKKMVVVGDLAQASPVKDDWIITSDFFRGIQDSGHFLKLTESHRQSEKPLLEALDFLRAGEVNDHVRDIFRPCMVSGDGGDSIDDTFLRLYATNNATDAYNNKRLSMLPTVGATVTLETQYQDLRDRYQQDKYPVTDSAREKQINDGSFAHNETFKLDARVLLTKNEGGEEGRYVNGDTGLIVDIIYQDGTSVRNAQPHNAFSSTPQPIVDHLVVHLDRLGYDIKLEKTSQSMKDASDKDLYMLTGFPIRLGWAQSIHKSQGQTVDKAFVDMSTILHMQGESMHGLAYVALSRTRRLDGLRISRWSDKAVYCSPAIKPFV